jgi:hypothetical protein
MGKTLASRCKVPVIWPVDNYSHSQLTDSLQPDSLGAVHRSTLRSPPYGPRQGATEQRTLCIRATPRLQHHAQCETRVLSSTDMEVLHWLLR